MTCTPTLLGDITPEKGDKINPTMMGEATPSGSDQLTTHKMSVASLAQNAAAIKNIENNNARIAGLEGKVEWLEKICLSLRETILDQQKELLDLKCVSKMGKQKLENPAPHQFAGGFTRAHDPVAQEAVHQDHEAAGPPSMGFRAQAAGFRTIPAHPASTSVLGGLGQGMLMEALLCQQAVDAPPLAQSGFKSRNVSDCKIQNVDVQPVSASSGTASLALLLGNLAGNRPMLVRKKQGGWQEFERAWTERISMFK